MNKNKITINNKQPLPIEIFYPPFPQRGTDSVPNNILLPTNYSLLVFG